MQLNPLLLLSRKWARASGLLLRSEKCVFIPAMMCRALCRVEHDKHEVSRKFGLQGHTTFLGFEVGPEARRMQWDSTVQNIERRIAVFFFRRASLRGYVSTTVMSFLC